MNLDSFNEILFKALKDQSPGGQMELLMIEREAAYGMKVQAMETLVERLNNGQPWRDALKNVNAINSSCDKLQSRIDEILEANPELRKALEEEEPEGGAEE